MARHEKLGNTGDKYFKAKYKRYTIHVYIIQKIIIQKIHDTNHIIWQMNAIDSVLGADRR